MGPAPAVEGVPCCCSAAPAKLDPFVEALLGWLPLRGKGMQFARALHVGTSPRCCDEGDCVGGRRCEHIGCVTPGGVVQVNVHCVTSCASYPGSCKSQCRFVNKMRHALRLSARQLASTLCF